MIHSIHHLVVATPNLETAVADYEALFARPPDGAIETEGARQVWFSTTNVRFVLTAPSGPGAAGDAVRTRLGSNGEGLWRIAFGVDDLAKTSNLFERRGLTPGPSFAMPIEGRGGADAAPACSLALSATHGVEMALVEARRNPGVAAADAGVSGLDHVVIRTPDPERAVALYGARLGLDMRLDRSNPAWGARLIFFRCGDLVVEIAHELKSGVSQSPDWFGGLSWRAPDLAATRARLLAHGRNLSDIRKGRRPGSHVCTLRDGTANTPTILLGLDPA